MIPITIELNQTGVLHPNSLMRKKRKIGWINSNRVSLVTEKTTTNLSNKIKIPWKCYNLCNQNPTIKNEQFKDIKGNWWSKIRYVILSHRRQLIRLNVVRELDSVEAVRGIVWFGNEGWLAAMK